MPRRVIRFEAQHPAGVRRRRPDAHRVRDGAHRRRPGPARRELRPFGSCGTSPSTTTPTSSGRRGTGINFDGEAWTPAGTRRTCRSRTAYRGSEAAPAGACSDADPQGERPAHPADRRRMGRPARDDDGAAYQAQMLAIFRRYGLSWARWAMSAHDVFGILTAAVAADRGLPAAAARARNRARRHRRRPGRTCRAFAVSRPRLSLARRRCPPDLLLLPARRRARGERPSRCAAAAAGSSATSMPARLPPGGWAAVAGAAETAGAGRCARARSSSASRRTTRPAAGSACGARSLCGRRSPTSRARPRSVNIYLSLICLSPCPRRP